MSNIEDSPRKYLYQLINREQHCVTALQYGMQRFASPLAERRDLISPTDHRTLFQNIEEILRIAEDILEQLIPDEHEPQLQFASRVYLTKSTAFCAAYKKYCNGLKRADCVLVSFSTVFFGLFTFSLAKSISDEKFIHFRSTNHASPTPSSSISSPCHKYRVSVPT